jgi:hypothetical protein
MGTKLKVSSSSSFEQRPIMNDDRFLLAKIVSYKESKAINTFNQKEDDYIVIEFDIIDKNLEIRNQEGKLIDSEDPEIRKTWSRCRRSLHPKSNLYKHYCEIMGTKLEPNEEVDLDDIVGVKCLILLTTKDKVNEETGNEYKSQFVSRLKTYTSKQKEDTEEKKKKETTKEKLKVEKSDDTEEEIKLVKQIIEKCKELMKDEDSKKELRKVLKEHDCIPTEKIKEAKLPTLKMIMLKLNKIGKKEEDVDFDFLDDKNL